MKWPLVLADGIRNQLAAVRVPPIRTNNPKIQPICGQPVGPHTGRGPQALDLVHGPEDLLGHVHYPESHC
jgi:hypothetical protein